MTSSFHSSSADLSSSSSWSSWQRASKHDSSRSHWSSIDSVLSTRSPNAGLLRTVRPTSTRPRSSIVPGRMTRSARCGTGTADYSRLDPPPTGSWYGVATSTAPSMRSSDCSDGSNGSSSRSINSVRPPRHDGGMSSELASEVDGAPAGEARLDAIRLRLVESIESEPVDELAARAVRRAAAGVAALGDIDCSALDAVELRGVAPRDRRTPSFGRRRRGCGGWCGGSPQPVPVAGVLLREDRHQAHVQVVRSRSPPPSPDRPPARCTPRLGGR